MKRTNKTQIQISIKQLERIKRGIADEITAKALLLAIAATADEFKFDEDKICRMAVRIQRYAEYLDEKLIQIKNVQTIIEKGTGIKFTGF